MKNISKVGEIYAKSYIIGSEGSGKSTLARQSGKISNIEVFHLDAIHWESGRIETPLDERTAIIDELCFNYCWIYDK